MRTVRRFGVILGTAGIAFLITACGGNGAPSNGGGLNLAGTWTVKTVSTQGQGNATGTATIMQTGQGLGVNGTTMLATPAGGMTLSQTGTAITGVITNSGKAVSEIVTGTLSKGSLTITGSGTCDLSITESASVSGTISSNSFQGTYAITRSPACGTPNDAGTFVATKQ